MANTVASCAAEEEFLRRFRYQALPRAESTPRDWKPPSPPDMTAWENYRFGAGLDESGIPVGKEDGP